MVDATKIKPHMPVVCSHHGQFAIVDRVEGGDSIRLAQDDAGQHHYIPLKWVRAVDDKVHIDRPGTKAMRDWSTSPGAVTHSASAMPLRTIAPRT